MNLPANYNVDLRKLFGSSAQKKRTAFVGPLSVCSRQLFKLASSLHTALDLKNLLESRNLLLCG